jgi:hypothetical protein
MTLRRSLYARPDIVRGKQCAGARPHAGRCCAAVQWRRRSGPRRRRCHRGAVPGGRAAPDAATRARFGRPAGGRRSPGCPDAGHAGRGRVRVRCPPCARPSNRSSRRPVSTRPVSTRPVSTRPVPSSCPDGQASGVRGSVAALSVPRWTLEWLGGAGRPVGAAGSTCRGPRAAWSPARTRPDGKGWGCVGRAWLARGFDGSPGRRFGGAPAAWRLAADRPRALVQRQSASRLAAEHETEQVLTSSPTGASWAGYRRGARPRGWTGQVVTTLRGHWAGDGSVSSSSGGPTRLGGERPAAAARPRDVKSAVRQVLTGP